MRGPGVGGRRVDDQWTVADLTTNRQPTPPTPDPSVIIFRPSQPFVGRGRSQETPGTTVVPVSGGALPGRAALVYLGPLGKDTDQATSRLTFPLAPPVRPSVPVVPTVLPQTVDDVQSRLRPVGVGDPVGPAVPGLHRRTPRVNRGVTRRNAPGVSGVVPSLPAVRAPPRPLLDLREEAVGRRGLPALRGDDVEVIVPPDGNDPSGDPSTSHPSAHPRVTEPSLSSHGHRGSSQPCVRTSGPLRGGRSRSSCGNGPGTGRPCSSNKGSSSGRSLTSNVGCPCRTPRNSSWTFHSGGSPRTRPTHPSSGSTEE